MPKKTTETKQASPGGKKSPKNIKTQGKSRLAASQSGGATKPKSGKKKMQEAENVEDFPNADMVEMDADLEFLVDPVDIIDDAIDDDFTEPEEDIEELEKLSSEDQATDAYREEAEDGNDIEDEDYDDGTEDEKDESEESESATEPDIESEEDEELEKSKSRSRKADNSKKAAKSTAQEWTCDGCFMRVASSHFGSSDNPVCPIGESSCPSIGKFF